MLEEHMNYSKRHKVVSSCLNGQVQKFQSSCDLKATYHVSFHILKGHPPCVFWEWLLDFRMFQLNQGILYNIRVYKIKCFYTSSSSNFLSLHMRIFLEIYSLFLIFIFSCHVSFIYSSLSFFSIFNKIILILIYIIFVGYK